jgi:endonuclease IV
MADRYGIGMLLLHPGTARDHEALEQLADALPDDAEVGEPDDVGAFEVAVEGEDVEEALQTLWDAVAASGTDDHIVFLEHPDLPEHWRHRSGSPQA